jgi:Universal stress protein family
VSYVLAAIDDSAATAPVIAVAQWFASLSDIEARALHITEDDTGATARAVADAAGVRLAVGHGDVVSMVCRAADNAEVRAVAIGARGVPASKTPAGHVALDLVCGIAKPVLVVPPDARVPSGTSAHVLAPVDEHLASSAALRDLLTQMPADTEVVLLRVFDAEHVPAFANHGTYDADAFAQELKRRGVASLAIESRVETRVGHPAHTILAAERELACDLVVLTWSRYLSDHHASVVRRLLAHSTTPLILLPEAENRAAHNCQLSDRNRHAPPVASTSRTR